MWLGEYHSIRLKNLQDVFTFLKGDFHEALSGEILLSHTLSALIESILYAGL